MKTKQEKLTIFFFTIAAIALVCVLVIFFNNTQKVKSTNEWVDHTQEVLRKSDNIMLDVLTIESGSRGFIITGDEIYLKNVDNSVNVINSNLASLQNLTKDNRKQQLRLSWLKTAVDERIVFTRYAIDERKNKGLKEAEKIIASGEGRRLTEKITSIIEDINADEYSLLKERKKENQNADSQTSILFIVLVCIIIAFALIILKNQKIRAHLSRKEKQASQYSRSLIEASLDPLVTINAAGKILDVNDALINVTGESREKLIGMDFSNYFTEPDKAKEGYQKVFEKGFVADYPLTIKHKNGNLTDVLYNASVYKDDKGNVRGVFAAARDVTNSKKVEEQLIAKNKELDGFSYSVSHDLRAPLRAINGYSKILQEDYASKMDEDGVSSLNAILKNSKRMGELIDDLLAFSRLGKKEVTVTEINMTGLVKSVREEEMNGNTDEIEFKIAELIPANGQQALIKQVWVNLISNAIKYSKHKPKTNIEIGSYFKDAQVVYYVKDNGAGFDMQYYDKLFGVFQRLHSAEEFEGTGIGLAIVQKIIQRHNGTVWADSILKEGTTFYFTLPTINI